MRQPRRGLRRAAFSGFASLIAAGTLASPASAGPALTGIQNAPPGPTVKLIAAQDSITEQSYGGVVFLDPGIYVTSLGSALEFYVQRASYTKQITITQIIHLPDGSTHNRPLPGGMLDDFYGLRNFLHLSVVDSSGQVVLSRRVSGAYRAQAARRVSVRLRGLALFAGMGYALGAVSCRRAPRPDVAARESRVPWRRRRGLARSAGPSAGTRADTGKTASSGHDPERPPMIDARSDRISAPHARSCRDEPLIGSRHDSRLRTVKRLARSARGRSAVVRRGDQLVLVGYPPAGMSGRAPD
jgi:hypothetical protein